MTRLRLLPILGILALVLCVPTHTLRAESPESSSASSHVLVGMTPNAGFEITCDDSLLYNEPVASDALGIVGFTVDQSDLPDIGMICLRQPGPPLVFDCTVTELDTSAVFCWQTDRPAWSHVEYGTSSGNYSDSSPEQLDLALDHEAALGMLTPEITYYYQVRSTDAFGNWTVTNELSFDTCPRRPYITDITVADVSATSFRVAWTTTTPADSRIEYGQQSSCDDGVVLLPDPVTDHEITVGDLSMDETYYFRVRSVDDCGCEAVSDVATVTTAAEAVQIIGVSLLDVTQTTATIRWWTTVPATSQVAYGTTPDYGHFSAFGADLVTGHLIVLDGLTPGTLYHFVAISTDVGGHEATSPDLTFATTPIDETELLVIYNVSVHVVDGPAATVQWTTNLPATSLVEYGADTGYGQTAADDEKVIQHSVALGGLETRMLYHFRVSSSAGHELEAVSNDMLFSTHGAADLSPPCAPEGLTATSRESSIDLSWETVLGAGLAGYTVYRRREGDLLYTNVDTVPEGQTTYSDASVQPGMYYDYAVAAHDAAGNESDLSAGVRIMAGAGAAGQIWIFPNPMVTQTSIRFAPPRAASESDRGGRNSLRIYDAVGRLVRTLDGGSSGPEPRTVRWNARDDSGQRVASGTYFCVVANQAGTLRSKLLVLR
ncbi:MAG: fibronectin type III domain-containing protein [Candidatus Eisenbacteria bacterium]